MSLFAELPEQTAPTRPPERFTFKPERYTRRRFRCNVYDRMKITPNNPEGFAAALYGFHSAAEARTAGYLHTIKERDE